jgi:hypothetical protein
MGVFETNMNATLIMATRNPYVGMAFMQWECVINDAPDRISTLRFNKKNLSDERVCIDQRAQLKAFELEPV